ncbi:MAG: glycoside hydrolase family 43 protein [Capsulimonas sp.]
MWIFSYFRQIYGDRVEITPNGVESVLLTEETMSSESLHLAYSDDGVKWTPLNDNKPALNSIAGQYIIRDPFIRKGPDGWFHLVATGGPTRRDIGYARSRDLVTWEDQRYIPIIRGDERARSAWAPEFFYDEDQENYFVFWSTSYGEHGWDDSRIFCARTKDFGTFTPPKILLDAGYTVIDATIVPWNGVWYIIFKDERFGYKHGEHRFMRVATAPALDGPYTVVTEAITPQLTEGPSLYRPSESGPWYLAYDYCMANGYGVSVSDDLLNWRILPEADFPVNARHGSVFEITDADFERLQSTLSAK